MKVTMLNLLSSSVRDFFAATSISISSWIVCNWMDGLSSLDETGVDDASKTLSRILQLQN